MNLGMLVDRSMCLDKEDKGVSDDEQLWKIYPEIVLHFMFND